MPKNVFAGVGISKNDDPFEAGKEAAEAAIKDLQSKCKNSPTFGIIFCSGGKYGKNDNTIKKFVDGIQSVFNKFKKIKWIGCTTAGEITPNGIEHGSAVVTVISSKYIKFGIGAAKNIDRNPFEAGRRAAENALRDLKIDKYVDAYISFLATKSKPPSELIKQRQFMVLALGAGFTIKKSGWEDEMINGIKDVVGDYTPIVGGSAGDDGRLMQTYQFENGRIYKKGVVLTVIFSNAKLGFGIAHGFEPTEKIALVTKSEGNVVYELNGSNAVDVYAKMIGISKKELLKGSGFLKLGEKIPAFINIMEKFGIKREDVMKKINVLKFMSENPFGIPDAQGNYWTKVPKMIIEKKYIEFYSKIPKNMPLMLLKSNKKKMLNASLNSVLQSIRGFKRQPAVVIIFECAGRYVSLGENANKSIQLIKNKMNTDITGFYTYAEYGFSRNMPSGNHYYTCVSLSISDELITQ